MALGDEEGPCAMHLRTKHSGTKHQAPSTTSDGAAVGVGKCMRRHSCM